MDHYVLLFVSNLARDVPEDVVEGIASQARWNNEQTGITGLMVFDGEHFAQWMEGPAEAVEKVAHVMQSDPRHTDMEVVHRAPVSVPRRFPAWRLGYLVLDLQEFGLRSLRGKRGPVAVEAFDFMLPALDISVGQAVPAKLSRSRR